MNEPEISKDSADRHPFDESMHENELETRSQQRVSQESTNISDNESIESENETGPFSLYNELGKLGGSQIIDDFFILKQNQTLDEEQEEFGNTNLESI
jgi:hypothetical protein